MKTVKISNKSSTVKQSKEGDKNLVEESIQDNNSKGDAIMKDINNTSSNDAWNSDRWKKDAGSKDKIGAWCVNRSEPSKDNSVCSKSNIETDKKKSDNVQADHIGNRKMDDKKSQSATPTINNRVKYSVRRRDHEQLYSRSQRYNNIRN